MSAISRSGSRSTVPAPAWRWLIVVGTLQLAFHAFPLKADDATAIDFFEKSIRPLIVEKCQSCHGEQKAKAGLRLTDRESLLKGGESGPAVVPAAPDESRLIRAVRYLDEPKMPPKQKLSAGEIAALERWVASGAPWPSSHDRHDDDGGLRADLRASKLVGVPARPERAAPGCQRFGRRRPMRSMPSSWTRSRSQGITPAHPADRRTWIRRATFDLTGLPPTPEAVAAFVADGSDAAFEKRRRSAPGLAGLRRALGAALARRGPLCRLLRRRPEDPHRQLRADRGLAVSRLGRRCLQPRPPVRPVHRPSDRRRPDAGPRTAARSIRPG